MARSKKTSALPTTMTDATWKKAYRQAMDIEAKIHAMGAVLPNHMRAKLDAAKAAFSAITDQVADEVGRVYDREETTDLASFDPSKL